MISGDSEDKPDFPFSFPTYEDWLEVAHQELEGANPLEKLTIRKGDIDIFPFYTKSQKEPESYTRLKPSSRPYNGARNWVNSPKILVSDERKANEVALAYLNSGAEGILFDCPSAKINPVGLLNNISLPDCTISFLIHESSPGWLMEFNQYVTDKFNKEEIKGCIFWQSINDSDVNIVKTFSDWSQFHALGIVVNPQQDAIDEIAQSLRKVVELVDTLTQNKIDIQNLLDQVSFSVSVGPDFFLEMAKIKSLRNLWNQVKGAYNIIRTKSLHIHAQSIAWSIESFQPHGNMIKSTTSAMAAIAGGCDSLTIEPEDQHHETMSRVAINVSTILREESHFSKVADPMAGSYYVDSITNQLSEKAWNKFQSLVKS